MPLYNYIDDDDGEIYEVEQGMNDVHELFISGKKLRRLFSIPNAAVKTRLDPFSSKDFVEKTGGMKGSVGDMLDMSAEMSAARAEKHDGVDPVQRKHFDDYEKRVGKKHLQDRKKVIDTPHVRAELD